MRRPVIALAVALVLGLAACGGDDGDAKDGATTSAAADARAAKAAYVRRADALCRRYERLADEVVPERTDTVEAAGEVSTAAADLAEEFLDDLDELGRPPGGAAPAERYVASVRASIGILRDVAAAARRKDRAEVQALIQDAGRHNEGQERAAREYGFRDCAADDDAARAGDRVARQGFAFEPPSGWTVRTGERVNDVATEATLRGPRADGFQANILVLRADAGGAALDAHARERADELRRAGWRVMTGPVPQTLGGEPAAFLALERRRGGATIDNRQTLAVRGGDVHVIQLTAARAGLAEAAQAFAHVTRTWRWTAG